VALIVNDLRSAEANDGRHGGKSVTPTKKPQVRISRRLRHLATSCANKRASWLREKTKLHDVGVLAVSAASGHKSRVVLILSRGATERKPIWRALSIFPIANQCGFG
jgi:hypothetical protein